MDGLADERMKPAPRSTTTTTTLQEDVIGMNQSFNWKPATAHVPPCEGGECLKSSKQGIEINKLLVVLPDQAVLSNGEHWKNVQLRSEMLDIIQCTEASLNY